LSAVSGEVQQRQIVAAPVAVERRDGLAYKVVGLVDQYGHIEARDGRVAQDGG
jgi:hypothetical protein